MFEEVPHISVGWFESKFQKPYPETSSVPPPPIPDCRHRRRLNSMSFNARADVFVPHALLLEGVTYRYGGVLYEVTAESLMWRPRAFVLLSVSHKTACDISIKFSLGVLWKKKTCLENSSYVKIGLVKIVLYLRAQTNFDLYFSCFSTDLCEIWYGRSPRSLVLGNSDFPEIRCSESHTLHFTRPEGTGEGRDEVFPRFSAFSPDLYKLCTQAISAWIYR